jgi:hypothetical protein
VGQVDAILAELKLITASQGFAPEFRYWILLCACFNSGKEHNIIKTWKTYERAFISLVQQDGKIGVKHLLQAIIMYFQKRHVEQAKFASTFMKLLVCDQNVFSEEQVINFYHKKSKLDKSCALYDRKLEKAFRANIESFVKWLE